MAKCSDICAVSKAAAGADDTHRTVFIDEMSGIQALERIAPGLPMVLGKVERREFEYKRHGTQTVIAAFNVATGEVEGTVGNTRTELRGFSATCSTAPLPLQSGTSCATTSTSISLNPSSGSLPTPAASRSISASKEKSGVLASKASREFLRIPQHRITFHFTPLPLDLEAKPLTG